MPYKDPERQRAYQRERNRKLRYIWIREHGPCRQCGSWRNLEVDHVDPSKKVSHRIWSWSVVRRNAELKKCQVLCRKHHSKKTSEWRAKNSPIQHGTNSAYTKRKCRCAECREDHRKVKQAWRDRRKMDGLSYT